MHNTTKFASALAFGLTTLVSCDCSDCGDPGAVQSVAPTGAAVEAVTTESSTARAFSPAGTPARALEDMVEAVRGGSLSTLIRLATTESERAELAAEWDKKRKAPYTEKDAADFAEFIGMLTADGAEATLFGMVEPQLAEAQQQLGMVAAMAPMMAAGALQEADAPEEATTMIATAGARLATLDIADPKKARRAISILCQGARALDLDSLEDVVALDFDALLGKGDTAMLALMGVLDVYGLGLEETLGSIRFETVEVTETTAELTMTMKLFGTTTDPMPVRMERVEGRWMLERPGEDADVQGD